MNDPYNPANTPLDAEATDPKALQAQIERQRLLRAAMRIGLERPSSTVFGEDKALNAPARAAALLVALGPQMAGQLLQRLSPTEAQKASSLLAAARSVPRDVLIDVLQRFKDITENKSEVPFDADSFVSAALGKLSAAESEGRQTSGARAVLEGKVPFYDVLCNIPVDVLKHYLSDEHPQLAATVLAILPPDRSAGVLALFDKPQRADLVRRVATLSPIEGSMLVHLNAWIADVVQKHLVESKGVEKRSFGGVDPVVELLSSLANNDGIEAIDELRRSDPELAAKVAAKTFFFDDFASLDERTLSDVLSEVPNGVLSVALRGVSDSVKEKFLSCLTERAARDVRFEMEINVRGAGAADIEERQREMVRIARALEQKGRVTLRKGATPRPV